MREALQFLVYTKFVRHRGISIEHVLADERRFPIILLVCLDGQKPRCLDLLFTIDDSILTRPRGGRFARRLRVFPGHGEADIDVSGLIGVAATATSKSPFAHPLPLTAVVYVPLTKPAVAVIVIDEPSLLYHFPSTRMITLKVVALMETFGATKLTESSFDVIY
jgi:hypothetical protein